MKFSKIIILGTILATCAPFALADALYGELDTTGAATITATGITFSSLSTAGAHKGQAKGRVDQDGQNSYHNFLDNTLFWYMPDHTGALPANAVTSFTFASVSAATPVHLYSISDGTKVLDFYLTFVDPSSIVVGVTQVLTGPTGHKVITVQGVTGSFEGSGYVTETGDPSHTHTAATFSLTNSGTGAGLKSFSTSLVSETPEPSGLALLGTGMLGVFGMARRKLRAA